MLVLAAAMALPVGARAAEADTMRVTGAITAHNACSLTLSNGGALSYGIIAADTLPPGTATLPEKSVQVSVVCSVPTYFALSLEDMRQTSDVYTRLFDFRKDRNGQRIGLYQLRTINNATVNGSSGFVVAWTTGGTDATPGCCWAPTSERWGTRITNDVRGFNQGGSTLASVTSAQFDVKVEAFIYSRTNWTLDGAQPLDGMFVMDLFYL
jgi:hypothetical protein